MNLQSRLRKVKMRVLPPSSRSFHDISGELHEEVARLSVQTAQLDAKLTQVLNRLSVQDEHARLRFEGLYRAEDEDPAAARRRFFASIPPSSGAKRKMQLANAKMMQALHGICQREGITYWFAYGTLIAALSRHGFIPWDDDIDLCMMREDALRLYDLLKEDDSYQITMVYDWFSPCRQLRFSLKNSEIPCFIDVSLYDWATDASKEHDDALRSLRLELMSEIHGSPETYAYWSERGWIVAPGSGYAVQSGPIDFDAQDAVRAQAAVEMIEGTFGDYQRRALEAGILCSREEATAVAYALDNTYDAPWRRTIWPKDMIFPVHDCPFESYSFTVPRDAYGVADECYPGWPYLPQDILGHDHFAGSYLSDARVLEALDVYLAE